MSKAKGRLPKFESEEDERRFRAESDSTDFVDWSTAHGRSFAKLHPTLRTISLRLPESMTMIASAALRYPTGPSHARWGI